MSDLIDRQQAIDAIYHHLPSVSRTRARTMLHELPPAQPEPCEDTVSRKAIIDWIDECQNHADKLYGYEEKALANVKRFITSLPPVTPKQRTGKWVDTGSNEEWYAREYECSECGDTMLGESNFCPNCGAKMGVTT